MVLLLGSILRFKENCYLAFLLHCCSYLPLSFGVLCDLAEVIGINKVPHLPISKCLSIHLFLSSFVLKRLVD